MRWALIESEKAGPSSRCEKAAALARDDDASPRRQIVNQVGIVNQGVKQVKAGIAPQRAPFEAQGKQRAQRLERLAFGYLPFEEEGFREFAFATDFEGAEILVPQTVVIHEPKVMRASSFLSFSRSAGSGDSVRRLARAKKRSRSASLEARPASIKSTRTRLALVFSVLARALTLLATRCGSETL